MTDIRLVSNIPSTARVMQIRGMFDIKAANTETVIIKDDLPDLNQRTWNIGLIVGASGTGKSTIARRRFAEAFDPTVSWNQESLIDNFDKKQPLKDIVNILTAVGLSSPPTWLRPFESLSTGEKFRATTARLLLDHPELVAVDEFTSVVDRTVAQVASCAIAKTVRQRQQKFVAVSCHYDIIDWLQPDWLYEPQSGHFEWRLLRQRPNIHARIISVDTPAWQLFARHHYLDNTLHKAARCYMCIVGNIPAVFIAVLPLPHPKLTGAYRVSRIVTMPDFQGIGIGSTVLSTIAAAYKAHHKNLYITTSHPALMRSLNKNTNWQMTRKPSRVTATGKTSTLNYKPESASRITASFRYIGDTNIEAAALL